MFTALLSAALYAATQAGAAAVAEPIAGVQSVKLETDEAVRRAMKTIRALVLRDHSLVTHRRMSLAGARAFHAAVKGEVERMFADAKIAPEADAALKAIGAEIMGGAEAVVGMKKDVEPIDGIVAIDEALADYGRRFDDPGWQPLR